jgi:ParB family chromosome partitioning protein
MSKQVTPLSARINRDTMFGRALNTPRVVELDLGEVIPNPDQPRRTYNEEGLQELASSIQRHGLIQPITVKETEGGKYLLVAGERRFRAHQLLGRETIFAIITGGNPDEISLIENIQREDLKPLEEAQAMARLMERHSYTQEELGQVIGKHQSTISALLRLNELPERIKDEYATSHSVSKSALIEVARVRDEDEQLKLWETVKEGGTVRKARTKKETGEVRDNQTPTTKMLAVGRSFVRRLNGISTEDLAANRDQCRELIDLHKQLGSYVQSLQQTLEK